MMRNTFTRALLLPSLALLTACGGLADKTGKNASAGSTDLVSSLGGGAANSIVSYYPAAGAYTAVPSSVQINFRSASLEAAGASAISSYSITCGGNPFAAQSVNFQAGLGSVTVSLPSISGLADGTLCTFSVSVGLHDSAGNFVSGEHTVSYTISSSGASSGGGAWNEAAFTTNTASAGSPGVGSGFMGIAASGVVMSGLLLNGSQNVNGISGVWSHGFASTATSYGPVQGTSAGGFSQLACPAGYRMTGVSGTAGAYLNSIAIQCKTQDQTQTYTSPTFGTAGTGSAFSLSCPAGQFVTDLNGTSDTYLESLYLGCR